MKFREFAIPMIASPPGNDTESLDRTHRSELLDRISWSIELKRAARLREFLRYVGKRSLDDDHVQISEHEIGVHVFGRSENYDTGVDNIVRVNASELRKRIAAYYASEGARETILLEIPRGSYTPQFRLRPLEPELPAEPPPTSPVPYLHDAGQPIPPPSIPSAAMWARLVPALAVILALAAVSLYLLQQNRILHKALYGWKSEPALGSFWSGMLESSRQTDIVLADTSFALVEDVLKKRISLNDYLNRDYVQQIQSSELSPELKTDLRIIASRSNGSLGDFRVAQDPPFRPALQPHASAVCSRLPSQRHQERQRHPDRQQPVQSLEQPL